MSTAVTTTGLLIELGRNSINSRVWLNGIEISEHLVSLTVRAVVGDITSATLQYSGAVTIQGEAGSIELRQAPHYVECRECGKAIHGVKVDDITITAKTDNHDAD